MARTPPPRLLLRGLLAGVLLLGAACSGRKTVYPVTGKVLFEGRPAAGAVVQFHPQDKADSNAVAPLGQVGADGTFRLTTYAHEDGAPAATPSRSPGACLPRAGTASTASWCRGAT